MRNHPYRGSAAYSTDLAEERGTTSHLQEGAQGCAYRLDSTSVDTQAGARLFDDLRAGRLALAFQPIRMATRNAACLYSEALLRRLPADADSDTATNATAADIFPSQSPSAIEALERLGWTTRLDSSVIWTVVRLLDQYPTQRLGCNVSPASLRAGAPWRQLLTCLQSQRSVARRLTLEITETSPIANRHEAMTLIDELQAVGVRIAVDDIGAGHSTVELLADVRPDMAKIDRSALHLDNSQASPDRLRELVKTCARYSPLVVVEGIETATELGAACRAGAHAVQGFLIEAPSLRPAWLQQAPAVVVDAYAQQPFATGGSDAPVASCS